MSDTRGGKEGAGQLVISGDVLDLFDNLHQPPHHRWDPPVTQNPAQGVQVRKGRGQNVDEQKEKIREVRDGKRNPVLGNAIRDATISHRFSLQSCCAVAS